MIKSTLPQYTLHDRDFLTWNPLERFQLWELICSIVLHNHFWPCLLEAIGSAQPMFIKAQQCSIILLGGASQNHGSLLCAKEKSSQLIYFHNREPICLRTEFAYSLCAIVGIIGSSYIKQNHKKGKYFCSWDSETKQNC